MTQQNIIDKTSKRLKRYGYCVFSFDAGTEEMIEKDFEFDEGYFYTWNSGTTTFDKGALIDADNLTIAEMLEIGMDFCCNNYIHKVKVEYAKLYSGQTLVIKLLAVAKLFEAGLGVFVNNCGDANYVALAKQYVQDRYDEQVLSEEQYNILYGLLDYTLPA